MGAWGTGIFENDSALDWFGDYEYQGASTVILTLFEVSETPNDDYLDVDMGASALAACEVVATAYGFPPKNEEDEFITQLSLHAVAIRNTDGLVAFSLKALDRVMDENSELLELWEESGGENEASFRSNVLDLRERLIKAIEQSGDD